jgi:5-deoxy-glucuronate isomerase
VAIDPKVAQWTYSGLYVAEVPAGGELSLDTDGKELVVLPLRGSGVAEVDGRVFQLKGRSGVFKAVSDFLYVPVGSDARLVSSDGGRFAFPWAKASRRFEPAYRSASQVPVEIRGAGSCTRQVNNFCTPESFPYAENLIAVEVITPEGNWSSYPPHKHDHAGPEETQLEEIYYFEVEKEKGFAIQRLYTLDGSLNLTEEVHTGDVVTIPFGYHGPSMAAPGYHLYYLNVMAGPERVWRFCYDPAHAWIRDTWESEAPDPRLPLTRPPAD